MSLTANDFIEFFTTIHGCEPFPWQRRLVGEVLERGWPRSLRLPTASGKTAVLDIAVFALAAQSHMPPAQRKACRRIALVIDRRIVVDDAYRRAERIRDAVAQARDGVLRRVADALRSLGGDRPLDDPLQVAVLRGGIYREDRWARTPVQPVILCSTVDQVGSRLLHRGYGLSPYAWPLHAALLGHDCLIILDEAHCSRPFLQTLRQIEQHRLEAQQPLPGPFAVVAMTATPHDSEAPFTLDAADRTNPVLQRRLSARKLASLVPLKGKSDDDIADAVIECVRKSLNWQHQDCSMPVSTILVVLNRVQAARTVREHLQQATQGRDRLDIDCLLLTGRCRSVERDAVLRAQAERLAAGRKPRQPSGARPLVVVATQCVEVGADLDADALITEVCPLDALCQRLGRLDRLGERGVSPVWIVARADAIGTVERPAEDPLYGSAPSRTWQWLQRYAESAKGGCDLGINALDASMAKVPEADLARMRAPTADAPTIFPVYCDLWVQTSPEPIVSPDPAVFLHGPQRAAPEVRIVWRGDLDAQRPSTWADTVAICPPTVGEGVPLPIHLARRWLSQVESDADDVLADIDAAQADGSPDEEELPAGRVALRWRGPDASQVIQALELRPGDVLVVPASYGGCDAEGWHGRPNTVTHDIAELALVAARRQAVLRLHPALLEQPAWERLRDLVRPLATLTADEGWPEELEAQVDAVLKEAARHDLPAGLHDVFVTLADDRHRQVLPHPSGLGVVVASRRRIGADFSDEDDTASLADRRVPLLTHVEQVASTAAGIARALGLDERIVRAVEWAGRLHDLGKADPRFQAWLCGGNPIRAAQAGLLAKSDGVPRSPGEQAAARARSGYPVGARHELLSVRLAESGRPLFSQDLDWDLVLHLVASHHGRCRPFAPVVQDERPLTVQLQLKGVLLAASSDTELARLDSGVAQRFWVLIRRYGWWGLSLLEACVRLADHRASEHPEENMS